MVYVYALKQLVGAQNWFKNIVFLNINMYEIQHQQNHNWFKGKNLKIKHINAIKFMV